MRKGRIILITALVLVSVVVAAIIIVLTNIDRIVKTAIEVYGSQATKTDVSVSSVKITLSSGEGAITGLTVANPRGFSTPYIFRLGFISARIDRSSITRNPIVIDSVTISGPEVFYELSHSGKSNFDVLKENLQQSEPVSRRQAGKKKAGEKEVRIAIKKLVFERGEITVRIPQVAGKPLSLKLPEVVLTDIGKDRGATPEEIAKILATALGEETAKAVARSEAERYLKNRGSELLQRFLGK